MIKKSFFLALALGFSLAVTSQDKLLTIQDAVLKGRTSLAPKRLQGLSFIPGCDKFAYVDNHVVKVGDNASGKLSDFVSMNDINKILKAEKKDSLKQMLIIEWKNEKQFYFLSGILELIYDGSSKKVLNSDRKQNDKMLESYDELNNSTYAYTENNNLFIHQKDSNYQITKDGTYTIVYGKTVHRDEFGIHKGTFWSPGGNYLAFYRMDQSDVTDYPVIDWTKYPAENNNIKYPMAGNKSHYVTLGIYDMKTGKTWYIKTEGDKEQYLTNIQWSPTEKTIYIAVLNRGQNHMKLNEYDVATGNFTRTLFEEKDEKYTEPLNPMYFVKNEKQFIWMSRRDGYNHAYLYNIDGTLVKQLTKGKWEVKSANGFDESYSRFFFHGNDQGSVNQDFYSVNIKSGEMTRLTSGAGFHTAMKDAKGKYIIDNFSSCHVPRENYIIDTKTKKSITIFKAENPLKEYKTGKWSLFTIKNN